MFGGRGGILRAVGQETGKWESPIRRSTISSFEVLARRFSPFCVPLVSFVVQVQPQKGLEGFGQSLDAGQETCE